MAPKNKYTRDEFIDAAIAIIRENGAGSLTAKSLADRLGISTRPVFTCFESMDNLRSDVRKRAIDIYKEYERRGLEDPVASRGIGREYISFARNERELYRLIFMSGSDSLFNPIEYISDLVYPSLSTIYSFSESECRFFITCMWLMIHGISALIVNGSCPYSDDEISAILSRESMSIYRTIRDIPMFSDLKEDIDDNICTECIRRRGEK